MELAIHVQESREVVSCALNGVVVRARLFVFILVFLPGYSLSVGESTDPDLFRSEIAKIEVRKPEGWHFQSLQAALENRAAVKMNDDEFQKMVQQLATTPLVVFSRHEEPYDKLNPTIQLLLRPAGPLEGKTGTEILQLVVPTLQAQFADFATAEGIHEIEVSGRPGARITIRYTLMTQDEREFPTRATLVITLRCGLRPHGGWRLVRPWRRARAAPVRPAAESNVIALG